MLFIRPEDRERMIVIEQEYRAQGIYAYAFIYCHTCQLVLYHYPLKETRELDGEKMRLATQVANASAYEHMHAFAVPHNVKVWRVGQHSALDSDGGFLPDNADLTASNEQAAELLHEENQKAFLLNWRAKHIQ